MYRKRTKSLNKTSDIRVPERIMTESSIKQYIKKLIIPGDLVIAQLAARGISPREIVTGSDARVSAAEHIRRKAVA